MIQIIRYSVYRTSSGDGEGHLEVDANCLVLSATEDHPCAQGEGHCEVDTDCQVLDSEISGVGWRVCDTSSR